MYSILISFYLFLYQDRAGLSLSNDVFFHYFQVIDMFVGTVNKIDKNVFLQSQYLVTLILAVESEYI